MTTFRLIGKTTKFRIVRRFDAAGFIPSVVGVSLCGRYETTARVADCEFDVTREQVAKACRAKAASWMTRERAFELYNL